MENALFTGMNNTRIGKEASLVSYTSLHRKSPKPSISFNSQSDPKQLPRKAKRRKKRKKKREKEEHGVRREADGDKMAARQLCDGEVGEGAGSLAQV